MKLLQELIKLTEAIKHHVNRDDLIAILDAFDKELTMAEEHCFLKVISELLELYGYDISESDLYYKMKAERSAGHRGSTMTNVHPDDVKNHLLKHHELNLDYSFLTSADEVKAALRREHPVVLSVRWSDSYYYVVKVLRDGLKDEADAFDEYLNKGATPEMVEKAKNGIVPYPNQEFMDNSKPEAITHALLCVGYDASEDAFIVRDYNSTDAHYDGFFKIEAKNFFDPVLKQRKISVVDAALEITVSKA